MKSTIMIIISSIKKIKSIIYNLCTHEYKKLYILQKKLKIYKNYRRIDHSLDLKILTLSASLTSESLFHS